MFNIKELYNKISNKVVEDIYDEKYLTNYIG
jgi:hypothetical protein